MRDPDAEPDSSAVRKRRSRAHQRGDHSLCRRESDCYDTAPPDPAPEPPAGTPSGLSDRGQRLWRDTTAVMKLSPPQRELLLDACRLADRLDRFDAMLHGGDVEWLTLRDGAGGTATLVVDRLLAESRMTAVALKTIVTELRQQADAAGGAPAEAPEQGGSILDQLAARRAARLADAAGS